MKKYTYSDSLAGMQDVVFSKLSDLVKYLEDFGRHGDDSTGIIYADDEPILMYESSPEGLDWQNYES